MSYYEIPTQTGYQQVNSEWTPSFDHAMYLLEQGRGSKLSFEEKEAYWMLWGSSTGQFDITVASDGVTLTSTLLAGVSVVAIGKDGSIRPPVDNNTPIWRKGNAGDDINAQRASDSITMLDGSSFYAGQVITIIKG